MVASPLARNFTSVAIQMSTRSPCWRAKSVPVPKIICATCCTVRVSSPCTRTFRCLPSMEFLHQCPPSLTCRCSGNKFAPRYHRAPLAHLARGIIIISRAQEALEYRVATQSARVLRQRDRRRRRRLLRLVLHAGDGHRHRPHAGRPPEYTEHLFRQLGWHLDGQTHGLVGARITNVHQGSAYGRAFRHVLLLFSNARFGEVTTVGK